MLRHTTAWTERYQLPIAFAAHGGALSLNGRFDEAVLALERGRGVPATLRAPEPGVVRHCLSMR
jgi:hypothetical protein